MSHGRHRRGALESGVQRRSRAARVERSRVERGRPWLAALAGALAVAAALLAALVSDPRLLRVAVLLAIAAAIPFGVAATSSGDRRLTDEVLALRASVDELLRRPLPAAPAPAVALAVASSGAATTLTAGNAGQPPYALPMSVAAERTDIRLSEFELAAAGAMAGPADDRRAGSQGLRLPLVQAALRAGTAAENGSAELAEDVAGGAGGGLGEPARADRRPLILDLVALENEVDARPAR